MIQIYVFLKVQSTLHSTHPLSECVRHDLTLRQGARPVRRKGSLVREVSMSLSLTAFAVTVLHCNTCYIHTITAKEDLPCYSTARCKGSFIRESSMPSLTSGVVTHMTLLNRFALARTGDWSHAFADHTISNLFIGQKDNQSSEQ